MTESEYLDFLRVSRVPEELHEGLVSYILHGRPPGSFLAAVLSNDLRAACSRADITNRYRLFDIVYFLYNYAPGVCWGDSRQVTAWSAHRGLEHCPPDEKKEGPHAAPIE